MWSHCSWEIKMEQESGQFYSQPCPWPFQELHLAAFCGSAPGEVEEHLPIANRLSVALC